MKYAAEHFLDENAQQWKLVRRAGLRPDIEAAQQMKESLDPLGKNSIV
ncbi:hypothetical protein [Coleofasciculus sp. FACHB-1120]|nr:hypothetical protein [Coleofasciculus sp. FACHB-1120]MBD2741292.1 hypothetical protein [Coleofasciculus sp. FACHB-1120]